VKQKNEIKEAGVDVFVLLMLLFEKRMSLSDDKEGNC
jgi:hypothetical protein